MTKKFFVTAILALLFTCDALPQLNTAYSRFGVGDIDYAYSARRLGMGELGSTVMDDQYLSILNPAVWSSVETVGVELGIKFHGAFNSTESETFYNSSGYFSGFSLAFPVYKPAGISLAGGIVPFSIVNYETQEVITDDPVSGGSYEAIYTGEGGLTKLFAGLSYELPFGVVTGASFDYYIGKIQHDAELIFNSTGVNNTKFTNTYENIFGYGGTFGLLSPNLNDALAIGGISDIRLGFSFSTQASLNADSLFIKNNGVTIDTLSYYRTKMILPVRLVAGLGISLNNNMHVYADYLFQPWENYKFNSVSEPYLRNTHKVSAGFEYNMRPGSRMRPEQFILRGGLSFEQTPYIINGHGVDQISISGGFSFPMGTGNTIDIALQYAMRGTTDNNLVRENIFRLGVGISLGEIWFEQFQR